MKIKLITTNKFLNSQLSDYATKTFVLKKRLLFTLFFIGCSFISFAQKKSLIIYRNGQVLFNESTSELDSVVFVDAVEKNDNGPLKVPGALSDDYLNMIKSGFEQRRNTAFLNQINTPLVREAILPPLSGSTVPYSRNYSYSLVDYAFKSFWNNNDITGANDALLENAQYYLNNPSYLYDRDSFYWSAEEWTRLLEFFGSNGTIASGRINSNTESKLYELMWLYINTYTPYAYAESTISETWDIDGSENHHAMQLTTFWHFSKLLKANSAYSGRLTTESKKAYQIYDRTTLYLKVYIKERMQKGMLVELANDSYNVELLKGFYNVYDFCVDTRLKSLTGMFFDLYWVSWAQESIKGVRGGGKARIYPGVNSNQGRTTMWKMAYYYLNINAEYQFKHELYTMATSAYRLPLVVMDIALSKNEMGAYEVKDRSLGLAKDGYWYAPFYRIRQDYGGIVRYSYCTPDFVMGTTHVGLYNHQSWTMISDQNRWQGIILDGDPNCRVYPQCKATSDSRNYNAHWSIQNKGCLITQKLEEPYSLRADTMGICFSTEGLSSKIATGGWLFHASNSAYIAVTPVSGGCYETVRDGKNWLMCKNPYSPVILQVGRKSDFTSYTDFQNKVKANPVSYNGSVLTYKSIYDDNFEFFTDKSSMPKVNGAVVNMVPSKVFDSPFVSSTFDSGIVTITKNDRTLVLDCNWYGN